MDELARCPYCSHPVSGEPVTLWDGRTYCRQCIEEVSPALYDFAAGGGELYDILDRDDVRWGHFMSLLGKWYLGLVMLLFGLPFSLAILAGKGDIWALVFVLVFFGGGGMILLSLQALIGVRVHRSRLPRRITLQNGQLVISAPKGEKNVTITDCRWFFGGTSVDQPSMFTQLRRSVVIQTPEEQIACGYCEDMLPHWHAFLSLARIPERPHHGCLRLIGIAGVGMILGLPIGIGIGFLVSAITKNHVWPATLGFMGLIEGATVALMYAGCTSEGAVAARKRFHPALAGIVFSAIGMKFGFIAGLPGAITCGSINGLFGVLIGWFCRAKIDAAEMERELTKQFGR